MPINEFSVAVFSHFVAQLHRIALALYLRQSQGYQAWLLACTDILEASERLSTTMDGSTTQIDLSQMSCQNDVNQCRQYVEDPKHNADHTVNE